MKDFSCKFEGDFNFLVNFFFVRILFIFLHSSLKSNDIVIPSPLDTNMSASSGYRRMGGWGKRDELMNGYKRLHSYYLNLVIK